MLNEYQQLDNSTVIKKIIDDPSYVKSEEFQTIEVKVPKEYDLFSEMKFAHEDYSPTLGNHLSEASLYDATQLQIMTGKDYLETTYDEWNDFMSESIEYENYVDLMGVSVLDVNLKSIYLSDIISGQTYKVNSLEGLSEKIKENIKEDYEIGNTYDLRNSQTYFETLALECERYKRNNKYINNPESVFIVKIEKEPKNPDLEGFYINENLAKHLSVFYSDSEKDAIKLSYYETNEFGQPTKENISGLKLEKEYIEKKEKAQIYEKTVDNNRESLSNHEEKHLFDKLVKGRLNSEQLKNVTRAFEKTRKYHPENNVDNESQKRQAYIQRMGLER